VLALTAVLGLPSLACGGIDLGTAGNFAVLAGSSATNTGSSLINGGDVGVCPGSGLTGFTSGTIVAPYTAHVGDAVAMQAQADLTLAYNAVAALTPGFNLTGQDLGGMVLTPGVYFFASSAQLTGKLTLDSLGDPNAQFVFQVGTTLTTASDASVVMINGGSAAGNTVFWQVGSSATLGTGTAFEGHILAMASITLTNGASILDGSALAIQGAVTLDTNQITKNPGTVPEPASLVLAAIGGALLALPGLARKLRGKP
jgi:type VI secretion system secreted protein VgrG